MSVVQRVVQVRAGGHGGGLAGRAAGLVAGAAPAHAHARLRSAHLRVRPARLRASHLPRPRHRGLQRWPRLFPHVRRHDHSQPYLVDCRRYYTGERFLSLLVPEMRHLEFPYFLWSK